MFKLTFLEDKNKDTLTKNGYLANILPIGLLVQDNGAEYLFRDFEISKADGNVEMILADRRNINGEKSNTLILACCLKKLGKLTEEKINEEVIRNLTDIDRDYLIMKIRDFTFGNDEPLRGTTTCDRCGNVETVENFDLDKLIIYKIENEKEYFNNFKIIKIDLNTPFDFRKNKIEFFTVKLPDGRIVEKAAPLVSINIGKWRNKIMQECILQFGELVNTGFTEVEITNLPVDIRKKVWKAIDGNNLGLIRKVETQCNNPSCNKIYNSIVSFENLFPLW